MQSDLQNVKMPVLLVQSRKDTTIPADSMDSLFQRIASSDKSKLWVEDSGHVVIREPEREKIFAEVKSYLKRLQG